MRRNYLIWFLASCCLVLLVLQTPFMTGEGSLAHGHLKVETNSSMQTILSSEAETQQGTAFHSHLQMNPLVPPYKLNTTINTLRLRSSNHNNGSKSETHPGDQRENKANEMALSQKPARLRSSHDEKYKLGTQQPLSVPKMCSKYAPSKYIWDADIESSESRSQIQPFAPTTWKIDIALKNALAKNHRLAYKEVSSAYEKPDFNEKIITIGKDFSHKRVATIKNAWCDVHGLIVDSNNCHVYRNAGCDTTKNTKLILKNNVNAYEKVITIAMPWGKEIWHFVGEALVGLAYLEDLHMYKIHVSEITPFVSQWLNLIGVNPEQIITGTIFAKTLIIPELGKCGNPSAQQILWLNRKVSQKIETSTSKHILLVKRSTSRAQKNWPEILTIVEGFNSSRVVVFDDGDLPPVKKQLDMFVNAHMIIAPHGAGLLNILASVPGTNVVEFMDTNNMNLCYARLAYILGMKYTGIEMKASSQKIYETLASLL